MMKALIRRSTETIIMMVMRSRTSHSMGDLNSLFVNYYDGKWIKTLLLQLYICIHIGKHIFCILKKESKIVNGREMFCNTMDGNFLFRIGQGRCALKYG